MTRELSRNEFLKAVISGGMAFTFSNVARSASSAPQARPNFVVVLSDDHACRSVGYSNPVVQTPHLDRLGREGVIFEQAYIATPICAASRASLLTGLYPQQHGTIALDSGGFLENVVKNQRFPTVARLLSEAGYDTAFCGKSHLGPPREYGFAEGEESRDTSDDDAFAFAERFIERRKEKETPFFLWVAARQPHIPLQPPPEWLERYRDVDIPIDPNFLESPPSGSVYNQGLPGEQYYRDSEAKNSIGNLSAGPPRTKEQIREFTRAYYAVISRLDHQIGGLVEKLQTTGVQENTVFIYLSDNGYHLGNHGLGNKITMHEESVRIPMLLHWPGLSRKGVRIPALVSSVDLFPTLLDLAGIPVPEGLAGLSFKPVLEHPGASHRSYVASECVGVGGKRGMGHRMVRTDRWKYILTDENEEFLFDEQADTYEMENVAGREAYHETLVQLRGYMREWMARVGDTHTLPPDA